MLSIYRTQQRQLYKDNLIAFESSVATHKDNIKTLVDVIYTEADTSKLAIHSQRLTTFAQQLIHDQSKVAHYKLCLEETKEWDV